MKNSQKKIQDSISIVKTSLNLSLLRGLGLFLALIIVIAVPIYFPPKVFGTFSLVFSVIQITCAAILAWPNQAYLRYGRETYSKTGNLGVTLGARLSIHFVMIVILTVLIFCFSGWVARYINVSQSSFKFLFLLALLLMPLPDIMFITAQACNRFWSYGWSSVIQRLTQLIAIFLVAMFAFEPTWELILFMSIIGYGLSALIAWYEIPNGSMRPIFMLSEIVKLLKYSWAMPMATLGAFLLQWMDLWFIRNYLDEISVGYYAWAYTIILLATNILVPLAAILSPRAIDLRVSKDEDGSIKIVNSIYSICLLGGVFLPLLICGFAFFASMWMPQKYLESLPIILILSSVFLCQMAMSFMEPLVYAREYLVSKMVLIVISMVVIKALLNFILIPILGIMGAAIATFMCYGIGMILQWYLLDYALDREIPSSWPIFLLAITAMGIAFLCLKNIFIASLIALLLMVFGLFLFRRLCISKNLPPIFAKIFGSRIYVWITASH